MAVEHINTETCIGCGTCVKTCPMDVLRLDPETGKSTIAYKNDCQICKLCETFCPVPGTITITLDRSIKPMVGWS